MYINISQIPYILLLYCCWICLNTFVAHNSQIDLALILKSCLHLQSANSQAPSFLLHHNNREPRECECELHLLILQFIVSNTFDSYFCLDK